MHNPKVTPKHNQSNQDKGEKMNVEIVEFYPYERDDKKEILKGTIHCYLVDLQLDLKGVHLSKRKGYWRVDLPSRIGTDPETGKKVRYPVISFIDREKTKELINIIREKSKDYILNESGK